MAGLRRQRHRRLCAETVLSGWGSWELDQSHGPICRSQALSQVFKTSILINSSHRPVLTVNSIFQFGVQYPELLFEDSSDVQLNKAVEAIQRLYSEPPPTPPASPGPPPGAPSWPVKPAHHYPAGCIPWSRWKETKGYPETLPRTYTLLSPSPTLTFLKRK